MPVAWNIDEYVRRSLATHHLHSIVELSSTEVDSKDEDFTSQRHSPNTEHAVKQAISQVQVYPEISPASHQKRSPSEHSDGDSGSGSDGGEEFSSTHFGESSINEEEGLHVKNRGYAFDLRYALQYFTEVGKH